MLSLILTGGTFGFSKGPGPLVQCVLVVIILSRRWRVQTTTWFIEKTRTLVVSQLQQSETSCRRVSGVFFLFFFFFYNKTLAEFNYTEGRRWLLADGSFFISLTISWCAGDFFFLLLSHCWIKTNLLVDMCLLIFIWGVTGSADVWTKNIQNGKAVNLNYLREN